VPRCIMPPYAQATLLHCLGEREHTDTLFDQPTLMETLYIDIVYVDILVVGNATVSMSIDETDHVEL
jgi:hypothetical protein